MQTDRHRQTQIDTDAYTDRHRYTDTDRYGQDTFGHRLRSRQTQADIDKMWTDRQRQAQLDTDTCTDRHR